MWLLTNDLFLSKINDKRLRKIIFTDRITIDLDQKLNFNKETLISFSICYVFLEA
jgi:hypothetical protein